MAALVSLDRLIAEVACADVRLPAAEGGRTVAHAPPPAASSRLQPPSVALEKKPVPQSAAAPPATTGAGECVPAALPPTVALYQRDTYLFSCEATVLAVGRLEGENEQEGATPRFAVVLDATCFHPQGGGQPADCGSIASLSGAGEPFAVSMVKKEPSGAVRHEGCFEGSGSKPAFEIGERVRCSVDAGARVKNARVHSAGHLIDVAMSRSGVGLRPTKGYHFTHGSYVEYDGKLDAKEREGLVTKLQVCNAATALA